MYCISAVAMWLLHNSLLSSHGRASLVPRLLPRNNFTYDLVKLLRGRREEAVQILSPSH